ncbi:hypothetical protein L484_006321 [Morus notabilis]|uniref:DOG1 domain-containing protein n=1 Tax=Morus notabilis TaxID=981085 RepID=W9QR65_9ROSA|nr:protein DOG1-like 4 [Morus notabilis]EXB38222.1 hypothetical protein L484_006321 [Morus notabilis]
MKTKVEETFSDFFEKWVSQLEELLQQLVQVSKTTNNDSDQLQALVARVTTHVKAYYTAKWAAAHEDVLAFFSPVWLSPLENAYQWVTGWKPSTVFRLVESLRKSGSATTLRGLTEQQVKTVEKLRLKIRLEEEKVEREMERQQVAMADRRMVELARLASRGGGGGEAAEEVLVEAALKGMFVGLERVMKAADCVRLKTLKGVLDELSPLQCVEFLAATCMLQLQLRQLGRKRSGGGGTNNATTTTAYY